MTEPTQDQPSDFAEEGIPDRQDGVPAAQWAEDPQPLPLSGDEPPDRTGTTAEEQLAGESLDDRLAQEEPDVVEPVAPNDEQRVDDELRDVDPATGEIVSPEEAIDASVEPDEGARTDAAAGTAANDVGTDAGGWSPEEPAKRTHRER